MKKEIRYSNRNEGFIPNKLEDTNSSRIAFDKHNRQSNAKEIPLWKFIQVKNKILPNQI